MFFLKLNVKKTKELIFDFRLIDNNHEDVNISDETAERVSSYKYLGDENLNWQDHTQKVQTKLNTRLSFLRKLFCIAIKVFRILF